MALGRHDNVNNFIMTLGRRPGLERRDGLQQPEQPWELMQLGNCGSPLETEAGWLVITHGVGPMRRYTLGALLLDLDDPTVVLGHLDEPLLSPEADEREGLRAQRRLLVREHDPRRRIWCSPTATPTSGRAWRRSRSPSCSPG